MEQRETLLVILGAGASHDCLPDGADFNFVSNAQAEVPGLLPRRRFVDVRPPLTQNLAERGPHLNWVLEKWRWARPVVDHLRRSLSTGASGTEQALTLEKALADYRNGAQFVPETPRHLLATSFYLRDLLWASTSYMLSSDLTGGVTNQLTLLRHLLTWAGKGDRYVVVVSFNYDLIFERAMESTWAFKPGEIGAYLEHDRLHLLKPHGSVQWGWPVPGGRNRGVDPWFLGHMAIEAALLDNVDRTNWVTVPLSTFEQKHRSNDAQQMVVPALALPIFGKNEFVWPPEQEARLRSLQGMVTRVLTVGWRGLEEHFVPLLNPLVKRKSRVLVVTGGDRGKDEAAETQSRLALHLNTDDEGWAHFAGGFSGLLGEGARRDRNERDLTWLLDEP